MLDGGSQDKGDGDYVLLGGHSMEEVATIHLRGLVEGCFSEDLNRGQTFTGVRVTPTGLQNRPVARRPSWEFSGRTSPVTGLKYPGWRK